MGNMGTQETVMFFAALAVSIIAVLVLVLKRKRSSWPDRLIALAAIATMMCTILPWYSSQFVKLSLWDKNDVTAIIIMGVGAMVLAELVMRVVMFGKSAQLGRSGKLLEGVALLVVSGIAAIFAIIRLADVPETQVVSTMVFLFEPGWGLWLGFGAIALLAVGGVLKLLEKRD